MAAAAVPGMWQAASARDLTSPDWTASTRSAHCQLDDIAYTTLLRDRITGSTLDARQDHALVNSSPGTAIGTWTGHRLARPRAREESCQVGYPAPRRRAPPGAHGAGVMTRRR